MIADAPPVITAYDGDTVTIDGEHIRLAEVDAPELGWRAHCDAERFLAVVAKDFTLKFVSSGGQIVVYHQGREKYRRTLATISVNGADLGQALVSAHLAVHWEGKRHDWCGQ